MEQFKMEWNMEIGSVVGEDVNMNHSRESAFRETILNVLMPNTICMMNEEI